MENTRLGLEVVWCEKHGTEPHFEQEDCLHPHLTDEVLQHQLIIAAARAGAARYNQEKVGIPLAPLKIV